MRWLKSMLGLQSEPELFLTGQTHPAQDALAAIDDLSRAAKINPETIEIYSALGNLYRLRGDLDRAIQIRTSLISRPNLSAQDKGRIYFELARDYSRAGILDRAEHALEKAKDISGLRPEISLELAALHAKYGDFVQASQQYRQCGHPIPAAHFLVRAACDQNETVNQKFLDQALEVYPASPEAWLEIINSQLRLPDWDHVIHSMRNALQVVRPDLAFLLLDPLVEFDHTPAFPMPAERLDALVEILKKQPQSLALIHYTGHLLRSQGRIDDAIGWQEKALLLHPAFWPARLELLTMSMPGQTLTPGFELQLSFLLDRAKQVKRFVCRKCGLKRSQIFFCCPKCMSWHSIALRELLND